MNADDAIVAELRDLAVRADPPPPELAETARSALALRRVDREVATMAALAELAYDSVDDELALSGVRGDTGPRLLTFEGGDVSVEIEVAAASATGQLRLVGQLVPPQPGDVDVRHPEGVITTEADDLGRFRCEGFPSGPVSLRCHLGDDAVARVVVTDWLAL